MAKPTGFMEYERALPPDRAPAERAKDWNEFHTAFKTKEEFRDQAARCMDCGTPFCHGGVVYDGAASGCPINNLIPEWNDLLYRGLWQEALSRLRLTNNFPEFTGRVCPAPCEGACTVGAITDAGRGDKERRGEHHRPRLGGRLARSRASRQAHGQARGRSSARGPPASPAPTSSTRRGTK